jgi:branched-chain amino acid transport system substrate-binding protein
MSSRTRGYYRLAVVAAFVAAAAVLPVAASLGSSTTTSVKRYPYTAAAKYLYGKDWKKHIGKKADPKKSPIYVGWVNTDAGVAGRPALTSIADMGAWLVNNQLGGVDGHPLVLKKCILQGNESDGQACGQRFANDSQVDLVLTGYDPVGGASFQQAMAGAKPLIVQSPNPTDFTAKNTWAIEGQTLLAGALFSWLRSIGKTKVAYVTGNLPLLVTTYNRVKAAFGAGIDLTPVYYDPTAPDVTPNLIAANLKQYDFIFLVSPSAGLCIPAMKAFDSLGLTGTVPINSNSVCQDLAVKQALGDFPKVLFSFYGPNIYSPFSKNGETAAYIQAARDTKSIVAINKESGSGMLSVSQVMMAAKLFRQIGVNKLSEQSLEQAIPQFHGPLFMGPPRLQYNQYSGFDNVGFAGERLYQYLGHGKYKAAAGGQWIVLPSNK